MIHESVEGILVGAVDAGITLGNLMTAAESMGLGVVPIGAIRNDPEAMIELLELPPHTFPIVGMCLGYAADNSHIKPRLPMQTYRHEETYRQEGLRAAIDDYDKTLTAHWRNVARDVGEPWSASVGSFYDKIYFPAVRPALHAQGFLNDK